MTAYRFTDKDRERDAARVHAEDCFHPLDWIIESAESGIVWCNLCGHQFGVGQLAWHAADPLHELHRYGPPCEHPSGQLDGAGRTAPGSLWRCKICGRDDLLYQFPNGVPAPPEMAAEMWRRA